MRKIILLFFVFTLLSACSQNEARQPNEEDNTPLPQGVSVKNSHIDIEDRNQYSDQERAKYLANLVSGLPSVNDATVVVLGNLAVVGINIDSDIDRSKVGSIKYSVTESLRRDPHGAGAIVIADPDLNARLKEVQEDMRAGKPIRGIMNELADIVGRIMPDLPPVDDNTNPEKSMEDTKKQTDKSNKQQLERMQEEQSNHHK